MRKSKFKTLAKNNFCVYFKKQTEQPAANALLRLPGFSGCGKTFTDKISDRENKWRKNTVFA